jgi:hypothetical protein
MAQKEHIKGAEGEIMLLEQAGHAANDETHTEADSETDAFPMYHKMPEAGQVRGYNSTHIVDEKVFQPQVTTFNDQVRREVIDDEIIAPMARDHKLPHSATYDERDQLDQLVSFGGCRGNHSALSSK